MTVTQIDLDDDALAEAMRLSGARSKKETDYEGWQEMRAASKAPAT
jgi:hypothetical protein